MVEWLLGLPRADSVAERLAIADSLHSPALMDVEVAQVVRRYVANGEVSAVAGERALNVLRDLGINRYTHELLLPVIWRLRHNLTAYDATFVALAALLDLPLVTLDQRLAQAPLAHLPERNVHIDLIT